LPFALSMRPLIWCRFMIFPRDALAERERGCGDESQVVAVVAERLARRQPQVRSGFLGVKPVGEAERAAARLAGAVAAPEAQALELERGARAVAASQLSRIAKRISRAEFSDAGQPGGRGRAQGDRSPSGEMRRDFADQQLAAEDRDDRAGGGQGSRVCSARPSGDSETQDKKGNLERLAHALPEIA